MTQTKVNQEQSDFDQVIVQIGNAGRFQKRFYITFNFILVILTALPYMNLIINMSVPDHWCHVPGRESTNYTMEEWKDLTIPMEVNSRGIQSYSKCKRFANKSRAIDIDILTNGTIQCDRGWEYDHTWYDLTAPSQNNWVCNDEMIPANTLAMGKFGEMVGIFVFGQLADNYGRKPVFFATLVTVQIGRIMSVFTSSWVYLFMFFSLVGSSPSSCVFQGPLIIALETSTVENRALINMMVCYGWSVGCIILPLIMYWLRDWVLFTLVSTLPCAIFLLSQPWIIESPRWLVSRGKTKRCIQEFKKIAKANNTQMPINCEAQLRKMCNEQSEPEVQTILGLFSSLRLAKNTIILVYCVSSVLLTYMCLAMNVNNLDGNPFLNFVLHGIVELPAHVIGKYICDRFGRRWTTFLSFCCTFIGCIAILFIIQDSSKAWFVRIVCIVIKFNVSIAFQSAGLQSIETYPTCIRQTGVGLGNIFASLVTIIGPYIVALGVSANALIPYFIYATIALIGAVACLFLPETLGQQLPQTLKDGSTFGCDQDIWGRTIERNNMLHDQVDIPLNNNTLV